MKALLCSAWHLLCAKKYANRLGSVAVGGVATNYVQRQVLSWREIYRAVKSR